MAQSFIIPSEKSIERRRRLAEVMGQQGTSTAPIQSWTQGAARLAQALSGGLDERQANQMENQRTSALQQALSSGSPDALLNSLDPQLMEIARVKIAQAQQAEQIAHQQRMEEHQAAQDAQSQNNWQATHDATVSHNAATEAQAAKPQASDVLGVIKNYENQPGVSGYQAVLPSLQSMNKSLSDPSAVADLDFVVGVAKILDPQSVVRESETGNVIASQSIPQTVLGQLNKFMTGNQALTPEVRGNLYRLARRRASELHSQGQTERNFYKKFGESYNIGEDQLRPLADLPPDAPAPPGAAPPPGSAAAAPAQPGVNRTQRGTSWQIVP